MNILFLITAYHEPAHLGRLCERLLATDGVRVTVQWDSSSLVRPEPYLPAGVDVCKTARRVSWGDGSYVRALLHTMSQQRATRFDWLVILSGQDYPIRPVTDLQSYLEALGPSALCMSVWSPVDGVPCPASTGYELHPQHRYYARYIWFPAALWEFLPAVVRRSILKLVRIPRRIGMKDRIHHNYLPPDNRPGFFIRRLSAPFSSSMPCRWGSDYLALSRRVFDDFWATVEGNQKLVHHFYHTLIPSESIFQTMLTPAWSDFNVGDNLHFSPFRQNVSHPDLLRPADLPIIEASGKWFARKFDAESRELLDQIDRKLLLI